MDGIAFFSLAHLCSAFCVGCLLDTGQSTGILDLIGLPMSAVLDAARCTLCDMLWTASGVDTGIIKKKGYQKNFKIEVCSHSRPALGIRSSL